jgi:hypothetical protein
MPVLNVRLSLAELVAFKARAAAMHTNVSEMVRRLVLADAPSVPKRRERTRRYRRRRSASEGPGAEQDGGHGSG